MQGFCCAKHLPYYFRWQLCGLPELSVYLGATKMKTSAAKAAKVEAAWASYVKAKADWAVAKDAWITNANAKVAAKADAAYTKTVRARGVWAKVRAKGQHG